MVRQLICITGTDRGVGLALAEQLLSAGHVVFAGGLHPDNEDMTRLKNAYPERLHAYHVDVSSDESVQKAAAWIKGKTDRLDYLINNAAILGDTGKTIEDAVNFNDVLLNYNVTAVGAIRMTNALIDPIMKGGKLIVGISSEAGSIGQSFREAWFGYCMAKAALNMGSTIIHNRIRKSGGRVMLLHPGWVKSLMSGTWSEEATYTPEQAAANILRCIEERGHELHEQPLYIEADTGKTLPW